MLSFKNYLSESLDSPQEYFITDDTKIPERIYASFYVDENPYVIALLESNVKGIYTLEVGRTKEGASKTSWWRFHSPSDIMPVLSTILQFVQGSMAWMQGKIRGVLVTFRAAQAQNATRAGKIAERLVKKSYVKSYNLVPVKQPEEGATKNKNRYLFVVKKGINPKTLFKTKSYAGYDFDGGETYVVDEIEPKKKLKTNTSLAKSTSYSFGNYSVDIGDEDILSKIESVKSKEDVKPTVAEIDVTSVIPEEMAAIFTSIPAFSSMVGKLKQFGYDESKLDWGNFKYVYESIPAHYKKLFKMNGIEPPFTDGTKAAIQNALKKVASSEESKQFEDKIKNWANNEMLSPTAKATSGLDLSSLVSTLPGTTLTTPMQYGGTWLNGDNDSYKTTSYIENDLGFKSKVSKLKNFDSAYTYTGSSYDTINSKMRNSINEFVSGKTLTKFDIDAAGLTGVGTAGKIIEAFEEIEPFPEPLWVYRGFSFPSSLKFDDYIKIGGDFVDPAFMSTSLLPTISFGYEVRIRIYIPKGSKVLPMLNLSKHDSEREILLPPLSVIRILDIEYINDQKFVTGAYIGTAYPDIIGQMKKQAGLTERYIPVTENKKEDKKYDPEGKFGGMMPLQISKKITDQIKSGKTKVTKPEKD